MTNLQTDLITSGLYFVAIEFSRLDLSIPYVYQRIPYVYRTYQVRFGILPEQSEIVGSIEQTHRFLRLD